ncbi:ParB/RepB/Spo0J family partition protein [Parvularcula sp. ZS-1/3]|uniref:ParB/RepB/Spo0J family partition protein n=1 Tax=Parvularcula mediterranea TaxID=2732508 RepID=A0A7Y3W3Y7_9PROT|nr:ParB/RepB/Spo0J family partition protein [Parvularcula mediterranea]NNU14707.1 ParB/RepB/Spo0J family partition protein [Parvularcula mediterranea]
MARKRILADAVSAAQQKSEAKDVSASKAAPQINPFAQREGALSDIAQGRVRDVRLRMVDPKACRMWEKHNRIYDLLNSENCADLIASIRAQGKQEIPAVVRRLKDDPEGFEYEVISGARRHFAVSHLREEENRREIFYLIEIKDLEDEEAFRFADLENRGRQDISDYERGREYMKALADYYEGNMTRMAQRMEVSKSLLSSYISIAKLPREVLDAYGDPREIAVRHGQQLSPLLKGESRERVLERAKEIAKAQDKARDIGGTLLMGGAEVFKLLKTTGKPPAAKKPKEVSEGAGGLPFLTARIEQDSLKLDIDLAAKPKPEELASAVVRAYEKLTSRR